jgi:hypothetical protein
MWLRTFARSTGVYDVLEPVYSRYQRWQWVRGSRQGSPPSAVKREVLRSTARQHGLRTLVETGTFRGDTVRALRSSFRTIYSIELDDGLYQEAVHRCRNQQNARLLMGDSAVLLPQVLRELTDPTLFWLDAHWSGLETATSDLETPILAELKAILAGAPVGSVVLIDDHREFVRGATDYPTADSIQQSALTAGYTFAVQDDIMHLYPATEAAAR